MGVSRWSDLGPFGPVWLCLIEVEKESCCTRNQKQEQQGKKQIKKKKKKKKKTKQNKKRQDRGYIEGDVEYTKSSK